MKFIRHIIISFCLVVALIAKAGEQPTAQKGGANQATNAELHLLQGTWEGVMVGQEKDGKITITITDSSLHFHRDTNFWFKTTITLRPGKDPKQLFATIKECPTASSIGQVVGAIFKIEDGTLILATGGGDRTPDGTPKSFESTEGNGVSRYELRKVQPPKEKPQKTI
jgi:uncharacterized protein (TIGR03067 family)